MTVTSLFNVVVRLYFNVVVRLHFLILHFPIRHPRPLYFSKRYTRDTS